MAEQNRNGQSIDPEVVEVDPKGMLTSVSRDEIDMQITVAHKYPRFSSRRGVEQFQRDILTLATADEIVARSMFYRLERKDRYGKKVAIEGPTVRMAEIVASQWRNLHCGGRVAGVDDNFITGQAFGWDLESNYRVGMEVKRRITTRDGYRYSDDMITTTANAAVAIAFRNAIFKVVPGALIKPALAEAKEVSTGKGQPMEKRRERAFKLMTEVGAKPTDILRYLERRSISDVTLEDLITLNGFYTAIKDGETSWISILEEFDGAQPKSEEDIKRNFATAFDDVEIVADKSQSGRTNPAGRATGSAVSPQAAGTPAAQTMDEGRLAVVQDAEGQPGVSGIGGGATDVAADELTEAEKTAAAEAFSRHKRSAAIKIAAIRETNPGFKDPASLKTRAELDLFNAALASL